MSYSLRQIMKEIDRVLRDQPTHPVDVAPKGSVQFDIFMKDLEAVGVRVLPDVPVVDDGNTLFLKLMWMSVTKVS